ncbi:uncharacterized protein TNCV_1058171 [Trichonephila clavipes]|nr:uncharacterized protein TNCV_1058171 [Trichonephila clavipes]
MTALLDELEHINSINGSHSFQEFTTMPSYVNVRNPMGRMHPPHPRPTASNDWQAPITLSAFVSMRNRIIGGAWKLRRHHTAILESAGPPDDTAKIQKNPKQQEG